MLRVIPVLCIWAVEIPAATIARSAKSGVNAFNDLRRVGKNESSEMDVRAPENAEPIYVVIKYGTNIRDAALNPVRPEDALNAKMAFSFRLAN